MLMCRAPYVKEEEKASCRTVCVILVFLFLKKKIICSFAPVKIPIWR
jgi:hypothetical protein